MKEIYEELRKIKKEVNVGIVGCGFWGTCFVKALKRSDFMIPRLLIDKDIDKCKKAYSEIGVKREDILYISSTKDLKKIKQYEYLVADDINFLENLQLFGVDIIHECTGGIISGAKTAFLSMENKIPFTTINSEMDATVGLILSKKASEKGVIYTNIEGDQPGCLAEMIDTVKLCGFEPRIVGNCKLFLDHYQTPKGVMPWVPEGGNPYSYSSAADGSKISLELSVVANAFNFPPLKRGMYGPNTKKAEIIKSFHKLINLDSLSGGHIDYTLGSTEPDMGGPIFVIGYTEDKWLKAEMKNYKKGAGPYYLFFRDHHLGSIEAPLTIARTLLFKEPFLFPKVWCSDVITVAKRDLKAGTKIDEIGGYDYYGLVEKADIVFQEKMLPLGLASFTTLKKDIKKDDIITYDDVELENNIATELRISQDLYWFGKS